MMGNLEGEPVLEAKLPAKRPKTKGIRLPIVDRMPGFRPTPQQLEFAENYLDQEGPPNIHVALHSSRLTETWWNGQKRDANFILWLEAMADHRNRWDLIRLGRGVMGRALESLGDEKPSRWIDLAIQLCAEPERGGKTAKKKLSPDQVVRRLKELYGALSPQNGA